MRPVTLGQLLKDKHAVVRAAATKNIGRFGLKANSAAPQLRAALIDDFADAWGRFSRR